MLSYDTRKLDSVISRPPKDIPKELIPGRSMNIDYTATDLPISTATKVPENAGMAALEKKVSKPFEMPPIRSRYKKEPEVYNDDLLQETSDALLNGIPEILHDPYRVNITEVESKPIRTSETKAMTRMEYIQYVREQCEKELSYIPRKPVEFVEEKVESDVTEPILLEETKTIETEEDSVNEEQTEQVEELPLVMKDNLKHGMTGEVKEKQKGGFLRVLWIRSIIAMCLFIGLVSFDLLNVRFGSVGIRDVKDVVANNKTIQRIEKMVSDFAENTVLPVFGVDKKED